MLNPALNAQLDQARTAILEFYPTLLWQFYAKLKEEGFTEPQALYLTNTYLMVFSTQRGEA